MCMFSLQCLAGGTLTAAGEIGNVDGQHRQQAGGNEGDDAFQKRNDVLHNYAPFDLMARVYRAGAVVSVILSQNGNTPGFPKTENRGYPIRLLLFVQCLAQHRGDQ